MLAFRHWLKAHLAWLRVPILDGPLRGRQIGLFCGLRFIRGRYDRSAVAALRALLGPGAVAYDIGAHVGYLSMVMAQSVGPQGRVIAFEPASLNQRYLRGHLRANRIGNVEVLPVCVSEHGGQVAFERGGGSGRGRIVPRTVGSTRAIALDEEIGAGRLPAPALIKMDVEGAELLALRGAQRTLREHRPTILLSVHGPHLREACTDFLVANGYDVQSGAKRGELLARPRA